MKLPLHITRECEAQIRDIDGWWQKNRSAAPELFLDELTETFSIIVDAPGIGHLYRRSPVSLVRRFLLAKTRYHVYYVALREEVRVLAVWHAQRGVGPPLRAQRS